MMAGAGQVEGGVSRCIACSCPGAVVDEKPDQPGVSPGSRLLQWRPAGLLRHMLPPPPAAVLLPAKFRLTHVDMGIYCLFHGPGRDHL